MAFEPDKYVVYFVDLEEGYYPEINQTSVKDPKNKWQYTYPHKDIVELMKSTVRALSRLDKKSIWLEGSYGTGKSQIIWMMHNLLSCPEKDFDDYFDEYDNLRGEIDLRERLRQLRRGKIVTAWEYGTGEITSTQKLIFKVFETLTATLKENGCKFDGAKTLRGKIVNWLEADKANLEMFRAKMKKPEYRMGSSMLASRSAEEIIERLKNPNAKVDSLVEEILNLGEREGIRAFNMEMKDLTAWISEVIAENNLQAIVLFWDEFSKFFANNRNNLDGLQMLAELSNLTPFYLFIATHESKSFTFMGDQSFKTISDRFISKNITMPNNIALELVGHALKIKDVAKDSWKNISAALRERTAEPRKVVMDFAKVRDEKILTDILPIHPMAAILLKNLAAYFASNQRSIFNFIKHSNPNVKTFQSFIQTKSPYDGDLLTIDYLWNFFYESGTGEDGGSVGRMNLKPSIRVILDSYVLNKDNLDPDEQAVLKTILLFQAVDQESHRGDVNIFRPTEDNLKLAFTGVADMENGRSVSIANNLVRKEILFKKPNKPGESPAFAAMALATDFAEMENLKKSITENVRTADLVESAKLIDSITLTSSQKYRYELHPVTADNFTLKINRITNERENYQIKVIVCFSRNEDEQNKIYNLICEAIRNERYHKLVFIDASSNLINREVFTRWVENSASENYWRKKDSSFADTMKNNATACLEEWKKSFENGSFVYYPATKNSDEERRKISCQNIGQITDELKKNLQQIYPYSFDNLNITDTFFLASNLKSLARAGIEQTEFSMLKSNQIKKIFGDVWQMSGKYWEVYPNLNISRLKIELDTMIKKEIEKSSNISFENIFEFLLERGFMPLNIYAVLTGFLLKEYAGDPYRFSEGIDGSHGGAMNFEKLAECISDSIKQVNSPVKNHYPKYLEIMSPNQRQFMKFESEIFGVSEDVSVEQSVQKLRSKLNNLGYPLWCYVDAAEDEYKKFLGGLADIVNTKQAVSISSLAEGAGQFLTNNPAAFHDLKNFLTSQKGNEIFDGFIKNFEGGIIFDLAKKIGIENPVKECQRRVTSGDSIWLHDKETAADDLKNLIVDWKIVAESSKFGINQKSFRACVKSWSDYCKFNLKIPADVIGDYYSEIKDFFTLLKELSKQTEIPQNNRNFFLQQLIDHAEIIHEAFSETKKVLRDKYSYQLTGLSEEEIDEVYSSLSSASFTDSHNNFNKNLNDLTKKIKSNQMKNKLSGLWRKVAGNNSPREWSKENRTPILSMVPKSERDVAEKVFKIVMTNAPEEKDVKFAIDYLEKHPSYFDSLNDKQKIERAFRNSIIGEEYRVLLDDNEEVRNELEQKFQGDAYQWYPNFRVKEIVEKFAEKKYYEGGACGKLTDKVMQMSDEKAKELLIELLDKNYEVGLKLLRES